MKVKLDENLGRGPAELLRQKGYEVDRVTDEGLSGKSDQIIWETVCRETRFFVTLDLDFSDVRRFAPGSHPGLLLLRPASSSQSAVEAVLKRVLGEFALNDLAGCFAVADGMSTRVRRPIPG